MDAVIEDCMRGVNSMNDVRELAAVDAEFWTESVQPALAFFCERFGRLVWTGKQMPLPSLLASWTNRRWQPA